MEIKVSVENVDLTSVIGERTTYREGDEDCGRESVTLGDAVAEKVAAALRKDGRYAGLKQRVMEIRDEEIRIAVVAEIRTALSGEFRVMNAYGEPSGKTTTLRELIAQKADQVLTRPLDTGYNARSNESPLGKFIRETVEAELRAEMASAIAEEKAKVVAAVRAKAAELIATAVKEGVGR